MTYRSVSFYSKETGLFTGRTLRGTGLTDELIDKHVLEGEARVDGLHDHLSQRVDVSKLGAGELATAAHVVDYQPPAPSADHEWNATTKRWQLNSTAADAHRKDLEARAQIRYLEAQVLPRALREVALGQEGAKDRVAKIDSQIEVLRKDLVHPAKDA